MEDTFCASGSTMHSNRSIAVAKQEKMKKQTKNFQVIVFSSNANITNLFPFLLKKIFTVDFLLGGYLLMISVFLYIQCRFLLAAMMCIFSVMHVLKSYRFNKRDISRVLLVCQLWKLFTFISLFLLSNLKYYIENKCFKTKHKSECQNETRFEI